MTAEDTLIEFIHDTDITDLPRDVRSVVTTMVSTNIGTIVAGSVEAGCTQLREFLVARGGREEARVLVHDDRLPAAAAAQLNATMARALDYEDALVPGLHLGASLIPTALACAELRGGIDGAGFLTAVAVGAEIGARLNLSEDAYRGFDPTGVAGPIAATATAARVLLLSRDDTKHALGLAFNRIAGSFQSNIDGSLAVRLIQGWVAESGVTCAQLAQHGLTGPSAFLDGIYGYAHLYGRGQITGDQIISELGRRWLSLAMGFKKHPSCGATQGITELALQAVADDVRVADVSQVEVTLPPYGYRLVGHRFEPGANPRVAAQFSAQYCAASALLRGSSRLEHFTPAAVTSDELRSVAERITVHSDRSLDDRGHGAVDLDIRTVDGRNHRYRLDTPPGFPGNPLTAQDHERRLLDCLAAAPDPIAADRIDQVMRSLTNLEQLDDVITDLVEPLVAEPVGARRP